MSGKKIIILLGSLFVVVMVIAIISATQPRTFDAKASLPQSKGEVKEVTISVEGMTCEACEKTITTITGRENGVTYVKASHTDKSAVVRFDMSQTTVEKVMESIRSTGYKVTGYSDKDGEYDARKLKIEPEKHEMKCGAGKCGASMKCGAK
jgi:copper chaperone CopZ